MTPADTPMPLFFSLHPADPRWGREALLSSNAQGVTLHLITKEDDSSQATLRRAGRQLAAQGIHALALMGNEWNLDHCWSLWQGFRSAKKEQKIDWPALPAHEQQELMHRLQIIDWMRDQINLPSAALTPLQFAQNVLQLLQHYAPHPLEYQLISGETVRERGYLGLYTVGRGSIHPPCFLCIDYNPHGDPEAPVFACLVGKGITFDSGGYNLKSSTAMEGMHTDMGGAALITASLALAIAKGVAKRIKLYLCCAENLVSGAAYRVGDIIHYRNGMRVEVLNTDAEGRLVLADGLIEASAQQPHWLIDCATLTGAAKNALGGDYHALFSFDDLLVQQLFTAAKQHGELFWRLPITQLHRKQLTSSTADLANIATVTPCAGASTAAAFLSHFVANYRQGWLHIDCAANYHKKATQQWAAGATGIGVLTLAELLLAQ